MNKQPVKYLQTDARWKSVPYAVPGESVTIGHSGCGPTCAAMLIQTLTGKTFTPKDACAWSLAHGYKALKQGTYYSYFVPQFAAFKVACKRLNTVSVYGSPNAPVHDEALALLKEGFYLIACMGVGHWTTSGHYIVVWWQDGKMRIHDPIGTRADRENGDIALFRSQVKYYWAVDARAHNKEEEDMTPEQLAEMLPAAFAILAKQDAAPWAKDALAWCREKGYMSGDGGGNQQPMKPLLRQEAAQLIKNILDK